MAHFEGLGLELPSNVLGSGQCLDQIAPGDGPQHRLVPSEFLRLGSQKSRRRNCMLPPLQLYQFG